MPTDDQSSGRPIEVFVPLLNPGTDVLRRTDGLVIGPNQVQLLAPADYNPIVECWQFPPGSRVTCVSEMHGGRQLFVARHRIP